MPAKFHAVSPTVWDRPQRLLGAPAKVVRYYIQTCPTRVSEGLFQLPIGIIVHDTGLTENDVRQGLAELEVAGFINYDELNEVILDRVALKVNPIRNGVVREGPNQGKPKPDNRLAAALRMFDQVPSSPLKDEFWNLARLYSPDLADALISEFGATEVAQPKVLPRSLQGPSREELSREELEKSVEVEQGCKVGGCDLPPCFRDSDGGDLFCEQHRGVAFGEVVRLCTADQSVQTPKPLPAHAPGAP